MQYIIYHDKSFESVTDEVGNLIWEKSTSGMKGAKINGQNYIFSSIAKILDEKKYFELYPDRIPEATPDNFKDKYGNMQVRKPTNFQREKMKEGFIKGYMMTWNNNREVAEQKFKEYFNI